MPTLYLACGIPGSGKSTYCVGICNLDPTIIYLSSDAMRAVIGKDETDQSVSAEVFAHLRFAAEYHLRNNRSVLIDATNTTVKSRGDFVRIARKVGARVEALVFSVSLEVAKARNAARARVVPEFVLERMFANWEDPSWPEVDEVKFL